MQIAGMIHTMIYGYSAKFYKQVTGFGDFFLIYKIKHFQNKAFKRNWQTITQ